MYSVFDLILYELSEIVAELVLMPAMLVEILAVLAFVFFILAERAADIALMLLELLS